jgi:class 3 adenylate cyclase
MPSIDPETRQRMSQAGRGLIDRAEEPLAATHRRHMEAALLAMWVRMTESQMVRHGVVGTPPARPPAMAFVDLSGFTRLTDQEAEEGEVLVSDAAAACASADLRLTELPAVILRGVREPVVLLRAELA